MWNIHDKNYRCNLFIVSYSVSKRIYCKERDAVIDVTSGSKMGEI
jgi:hypothetical protein